jgi:hypothetical protein
MSPLGEPRFFAFDENNPSHWEKVPKVFPITNLKDYERLFDGVTIEKAIGEKSPEYLNNTSAPERIRQTLPGVHLIAILRNPIDRAYSALQMEARAGRYLGPIPPEKVSCDERWIKVSMYYFNIKRYFDTFSKDQIKIILFDDFAVKTAEVLKEIFNFLKVDQTFKPVLGVKYNKGGVPKSSILYSILKYRRSMYHFKPYVPTAIRVAYRKLRSSTLVKASPLSPEIRHQMGELFKCDILRLQDLLGKDLSHWK